MLSTDSNSSPNSSYREILASSSIIGGVQIFIFILGVVRTKILAILLGPAGIGLVSIYSSSLTLIGSVSRCGIGQSGVREIAKSHSAYSQEGVSHTVTTLRRTSYVTGVFGWLLAIFFSAPLSEWMFGDRSKSTAIAILGSCLLFQALAATHCALLQGTRRIRELALHNFFSAIISTIATIALYMWLGTRGILPALILTAGITMTTSLWFSRRVTLPKVAQSPRQTLVNSKGLFKIGIAFMVSATLAAVVDLGLRTFIIRNSGLDANGIYQAAWVISGMFAGFILSAMGADFFPRVTGLSANHRSMNRLVNEQTEIGILLAVPGLLGTIAFAPQLMRVFYSEAFLVGSDLLPFFVIGVFGKIICWPMDFIQLAKGASGWYIITQTLFSVLHLALGVLSLNHFGIIGVAYAFATVYFFHLIWLKWISNHLTNYRWSKSVLQLLINSGVFLGGGIAVGLFSNGLKEALLGGGLTLVSLIYALRGVANRVGKNNRIIELVCRVPGGAYLCFGLARKSDTSNR